MCSSDKSDKEAEEKMTKAFLGPPVTLERSMSHQIQKPIKASASDLDSATTVNGAEESQLKRVISEAQIDQKLEADKVQECSVCCCQVADFFLQDVCPCSKTCQKCLLEHLTELIETNLSTEIQCACCDDDLDPTRLRKFLESHGNHRFQKFLNIYDRHCISRALALDAKVVFCPADGCDFALLVEKGTCCAPIVCHKCNAEFCPKCGTTHELDTACPVVDEIPLAGNCLDQKWRQCPQCRLPIFKDGGCNAMDCTRCRHVFCWYCGLPNPHHAECDQATADAEQQQT